MPPKKRTTARKAAPASKFPAISSETVVRAPGSPPSAHARVDIRDAKNQASEFNVGLQSQHMGPRTPGRGRRPEDYEDEEEVEEQEVESEDDEEGVDSDYLQSLLDNYELEATSRTRLLRNRIQNNILLMLDRRLAMEQTRLAPALNTVTAGEHMERDGGDLHITMAIAARAMVEGELGVGGRKRAAEEEDGEARYSELERGGFGMTEVEKSARKRKRVHTNGSTSTVGRPIPRQTVEEDGSFVVIPRPGANGATAKRGTAVVKGKGKCKAQGPEPTLYPRAAEPFGRSRSATADPSTSTSGQSNNFTYVANHSQTSANQQSSSFPLQPSNGRSALVANKAKRPRVARQNENLLSVNGSPVLVAADDDDEAPELEEREGMELDPAPGRGQGRATRSRGSSVLSDGGGVKGKSSAQGKGKGKPKAALGTAPSGAFTFSEASRWKELEEQLLRTAMDNEARARLQAMVAQLRMTKLGS